MTWCRRRRTGIDRNGPLELAADLPDPQADFADATVLRLRLSGQRRQAVEAVRWLEPDTATWRYGSTRTTAPPRSGRDDTFCPVPGLADPHWASFRSYNYPEPLSAAREPDPAHRPDDGRRRRHRPAGRHFPHLLARAPESEASGPGLRICSVLDNLVRIVLLRWQGYEQWGLHHPPPPDGGHGSEYRAALPFALPRAAESP
jgi:hypothetical protein